MSARSVYLVPPATANGPLHLGHLSGPYLAVDMAARAARARGEDAIVLGGIDTNQNWILMRAQQDGLDVRKVVESFRRDILHAYAAARLHYDSLVDPLTAAHQANVARLADDLATTPDVTIARTVMLRCADCGRTLHHAYVVGACPRCGAQAMGGGCEGCGGYTSAETLVSPGCACCGGAPEEFTATSATLDLEPHRDYLTGLWRNTPASGRARAVIDDYLSSRLPAVPIAYPTDFGPEGTGSLAGLRLDVYLEVGLGTIHGAAAATSPDMHGLAATRAALDDTRIWHFNGIDNAFYVLLFWPVVYHLCGSRIAGAVTNEFYTLDGAKFSTSRDHAIWATDFLAEEDPALVRLYLAWDRPDRYGSDFTRTGFHAFAAHVRPLLDGTTPVPPLPAGLAEAEVRRGLAALRPESFDPALAARCLLGALACPEPVPGRDALRCALLGR